MYATSFQCASCGETSEIVNAPLLCEKCGDGLLVTRYDAGRMRSELSRDDLISGPKSLWRYLEFLPVEKENIVTLGEGMTQLVESDKLRQKWNLGHLGFKLEFTNPTGSFKDRGTTVSVSALKAGGVSSAFDDSSGNAGSSLAAYCARAGIACKIFAPSGTSVQKLVQTRIYGAKVVGVKGPRTAAFRAAMKAWRDKQGVYASHMRSPFFLEGTKTLALEVAEQMDWDVPDHVVFPVGGGSLLLGAFNGFTQLRELNWTKRIPRLHCIQSENCKPIVDAYELRRLEVVPVKESPTVAAGIRISNPPWGAQVLAALRSARGSAMAVTDEEIVAAQRLLASQEGLFAEPTSCAALAGLEKLIEWGAIGSGESVIVPLTGSGLKQIEVGGDSSASWKARRHID